jgi:hypothetical protein
VPDSTTDQLIAVLRESMRMWIEKQPPAGTPAGLDLGPVNWAAVVNSVEQVLSDCLGKSRGR